MGLILRSLVTCFFVTYALGLDFNFPSTNSCILVHINVVSFNLSDDKDAVHLSDPMLDISKSSCSEKENTAILALKWENKSDSMTFTFMRSHKVAMEVIYKFIPLEHFPKSDDSNLTVMESPTNITLSMNNMSYKCESPQDISFKNGMYKLVMSIAQVQVQAFDVENGNFSKFEKCSEDTLTTETPASETTTHHKLTTTGSSPITEPPQYHYMFPERGPACILLNAAIQLDINYTDTMNATKTAEVYLPDPNAKVVEVNGQCDNVSASIMLSWKLRRSTFSITMNFTTDKKENKNDARLEVIEVKAELNKEEFPDLDDNSTEVMSHKNVDLFSTSKATYYKCNSRQEEKLDNTTMVVIYKIQVQAFGVTKSKFTGPGTECSQDITSEIPTTATTSTETTANTTSQTTSTTHTNGTMTTSSGTTATTSASISTTASPPHHTNNYTVSDGNVTCVYFQAGMDFIFPYTTMNGTNTSTVVSVPPNFNVSGNCGQNGTTNENELNISFYTNWSLTFVFGPDNSSNQLGDSKSTTYSVKSIRLDYTMQHSLFPGYNRSETDIHNTMANITGPLFQSKINGSYKCNVQSEVPFSGDIKLETYDLQYKAFNKDNKTDFGGDLTECAGDNSSDNKTNSIVPIAVGAALAGLVVIVLIAYLIGRRRNRKGYESV